MNRALVFPTLLAMLLCGSAFGSGPIITEFMASNGSTLADEDGDFSDWIEIHNPTAEAIHLNAWYLTDDEEDLTMWRFPMVTIPADGYLVVFASGKDRAVAGEQLHTNFSLSRSGEYLALVRPDGVTIVQEFAPEFPPQMRDVSYGLGEIGYTFPGGKYHDDRLIIIKVICILGFHYLHNRSGIIESFYQYVFYRSCQPSSAFAIEDINLN